MGILDDAIREHLELKRKHGVPEEVVERQEEEALGPARREVAQQAEDAEIAADAGDDTSLFDGDGRAAPVAEAPAVQADEAAVAEPPSEREAAPEPEPPVEAHVEPPAVEEPAEPPAPEPVPEPVPDPEPEPDPHEALGDTEPHGFPALEDDEVPEHDDSGEDDHPASDAEDDDPDVLEDTPDFLQETPEHDRLWFEQKPPRDFDFD